MKEGTLIFGLSPTKPIFRSVLLVVISAGPGLLANADAGRWARSGSRCQEAGRNKIENECDWADKPANDTERQVDIRRGREGLGPRMRPHSGQKRPKQGTHAEVKLRPPGIRLLTKLECKSMRQ